MAASDKFLKKVGKNIDRLRKEQGLSFQELAHRCELEKATLVKITGQGSNITLTTLHKIAKGLKVDPKVLLDT